MLEKYASSFICAGFELVIRIELREISHPTVHAQLSTLVPPLPTHSGFAVKRYAI